jgi:asparagine synthase (glutamine-hydrolysing)
MCGIAGGTNISEDAVAAMLDRIRHRGPDGSGIKSAGNVVHGHVRLALVDLTAASAQPFACDGRLLTFNGEVWNYRELRKRLGGLFNTTGDTEVLAKWLNAYGLDGLREVDGMFAFAWSSPGGKHWLVRDSFGKVPLYVAKHKKGFMWASERKAFPRDVQPLAVPAGHAFDLTTGTWKRWYTLAPRRPLLAADLLASLKAGVLKRLDADAPVCCLISGGLDSSLVLALAVESRKDVTAYTAVVNRDAEDAKSARKLCSDLGVRLVEVHCCVNSEAVMQAMESIEIPSKAQVEIAALCLPLAKQIAADGFKACLSGEAADELFGGYGNFCIKASSASDSQVIALRKEALGKMARGNFIRCNKAFMSAGVECRLPFMEQSLAETAVQLTKHESPPGKKLLKEAAKQVLPKWVISRQKDTFQGGSGASDRIAATIASPIKFYNATLKKRFGYLPKD